tara:strand:- start:659 stop:925 length:267 start_codon:yes stop_codon:yes gene_type:complete
MKDLKVFQYNDMYSGGRRKTNYETIFVYATDLCEADKLFEEKLNLDPNESACLCCGADYVIDQVPKISIQNYRKNILIINNPHQRSTK